MTPFNIGTLVTKSKGFLYTGTIRSVFTTEAGETRVVVEMWKYSNSKQDYKPTGMLHIYSAEQIRSCKDRTEFWDSIDA